MQDHSANREKVIEALREELVGPSPQGQEINCGSEITFPDAAQSYGPLEAGGNWGRNTTAGPADQEVRCGSSIPGWD